MIDNVIIGKKLGVGSFGTTYLCTHKGKKYALKIQKILKTDRKRNIRSKVLQEIDLYEYINTMPPSDRVFFTRLYDYKIYDKCDHKQAMDLINEETKKLNTSTWCIKYMMDHKGINLAEYLGKYRKKLIPRDIYLMCIQVINIVMLLHKGGYTHNDLHTKNITVMPTNKKFFTFKGKRIDYNRIQLSAIDYGVISHKKFKTDRVKRSFMFTEEWLLYSMYLPIVNIIENSWYYFDYDKKINKYKPEKKVGTGFLNHMFRKHMKFCNERIAKYIRVYPKSLSAINKYYSVYETDIYIHDILTEKESFYFSLVIDRLISEFVIEYPNIFKKYERRNYDILYMLPKNEYLEIMSITDTKSMINYFIAKV